MNPEIFKAYDIRGKVGDELNEDVSERVGKAFASWLLKDGVVAVGYDMRPDSASLANALIKGLQEQGRDVMDIGQVTSDMIYFAVGEYNLAGGAMITASHNPGEYNGIKLCRDEAQAVGIESGLSEICELAMRNDFTLHKEAGTVTKKDITNAWVQHVLSFIDASKLRPMHIAVDAGNGMAGKIFPSIEQHVPFKIDEMFFELDGTFPNHIANPLIFTTLTDLIDRIRDKRLDGGVAFDGDGDRAFLIDETGEVLTGGVMSAMLAEYFLKKFPGSNIVYDIRNSKTVPEVVTENGGTPVVERVGHSFLKQKMREVDAPFGGEASGHFYFRDNWYADSGLIAAMIGLSVASESGEKLSMLRKKYSRYPAIPETNYGVSDKEKVLADIRDAFSDGDIDELDGVTVRYPNCWFNVRTSNTEPLLRLNAEADSQKTLDELVERVAEIINSK